MGLKNINVSVDCDGHVHNSRLLAMVIDVLRAVDSWGDYISAPCPQCGRVRLMPSVLLKTQKGKGPKDKPHTHALACEKCGWLMTFAMLDDTVSRLG